MIDVRPMAASDIDETSLMMWQAMAAVMPAAITIDPSTRSRRGRRRAEHLLATDAGGSFVAVHEGTIVGVGMAILREGLWGLSQLAVHPGHQGRQIGHRLLDATLAYGEHVRGRLIASSTDPRAMRRYRHAGLDLIPCVSASGALRAAAIPAALTSRTGVLPADQELCDRVSRHVRGAAHGSDVGALMASHGGVLLVHDGGGWAIALDGSPLILAALDDAIAADLLWAVFASGPRGGTVHVDPLSAGQQWAIDVSLQAGLALSPDAPIFAAGDVGPLAPYLPSGSYL